MPSTNFRFNIPVSAHDDFIMQRMVVSACRRGDVVVLLSLPGRTRATVEVALIARQTGAMTIAITAAGSPLAQVARMTLAVKAPEDTEIYMHMQSRLVQLTLLDVLATGVILRRGEDFHGHLRHIKQSLRGTRLQPDESPAVDQFDQNQ